MKQVDVAITLQGPTKDPTTAAKVLITSLGYRIKDDDTVLLKLRGGSRAAYLTLPLSVLRQIIQESKD